MRIRWIASLALSGLLAACGSPQKARDCDGEFHPINALDKSAGLSHAQGVALCKKGGLDEHQG